MSQPNLSEVVQRALQDFIQAHKEMHTAMDVLRTFQREAQLQFETELVKDMLLQDPFDRFQDLQDNIKRLLQLIRVTDCHRILTKAGYSSIDATVRLNADDTMKKNGVASHLQLMFKYERSPADKSEHGPASVWYSIDLNRDNGPNERVLWVQVLAAGQTPSHLPAENMDQDDDDDEEWEEMDAEDNDREASIEEEDENSSDSKRHGTSIEIGLDQESAINDDDESRDKYVAGMDPEVLGRFLQWTQLGPMDEATAFFLLMTFPFYEHEWDLVGFVLDAVFGFTDDAQSSADQSMKEHGNGDSDDDFS